MCEATKQMKTILDGEIKTPVTKAILIFAETVDKSLTNIEEQLCEDRDYTKERFKEIIHLLEKQNEDSNKRHEESIKRHRDTEKRFMDSDKNIQLLVEQRKEDCNRHKKDIDTRFKEFETVTEDLSYFKKNPKLLKIVGISIAIIIIYLLGKSDFISTMLKL